MQYTRGHGCVDEDVDDFFKEFDVDLDLDDNTENPAAAAPASPVSPSNTGSMAEAQDGMLALQCCAGFTLWGCLKMSF